MNLLAFLQQNWMLVLVALASGGLLLWPGIVAGTRSGLTPTDAVQLINREKAVVVDVREADEFASGHITGSRHIPVAEFEKRLPEVVKNKQLPLILVCAAGPRANRCLGQAKTLGYEKAVVLAGGLRAWNEANLPVEKT